METREFECEVCSVRATLTNDEAYQAGWDYPPFMGIAGVISPRTCGYCGIEMTVWWALVMNNIPVSELSDHQRTVILRIQAEVL